MTEGSHSDERKDMRKASAAAAPLCLISQGHETLSRSPTGEIGHAEVQDVEEPRGIAAAATKF